MTLLCLHLSWSTCPLTVIEPYWKSAKNLLAPGGWPIVVEGYEEARIM